LNPVPAFASDPICTDGVERLRVRVHEPRQPDALTLVYLPGIHGDWTLNAPLRLALERRFRYVDMTYPRNADWDLDQYAASIEAELHSRGINAGWLLGESFGSQVLWQLIKRSHFRCEGIILAGGFVNYPHPRLLSFARWFCPKVSNRLLRGALNGYAFYARIRFSKSPEALEGARDFVARRTLEDQKAIFRRMELIARNDPREMARSTKIPVHHLYGLFDPIVPWPRVSAWLKKNCSGLRGANRVWNSDHTILATAYQESAEQIGQWMA
jgi:pimeloyl-[acyl-carrier protein] methyl ester esterase